MSKDILFKYDDNVFSYRIAGILIKNDSILVQKPKSEDEYALPGGHVSFGETNEETLKREFLEETGIDIIVKDLKLIGEVYFTHNNMKWTQISLYYFVEAINEISDRPFEGIELDSKGKAKLDFVWLKQEDLLKCDLYPLEIREHLIKPDKEIRYFISMQ
jgi:ADP-ribose pyrophosphatase YjhB (NUDIX family)